MQSSCTDIEAAVLFDANSLPRTFFFSSQGNVDLPSTGAFSPQRVPCTSPSHLCAPAHPLQCMGHLSTTSCTMRHMDQSIPFLLIQMMMTQTEEPRPGLGWGACNQWCILSQGRHTAQVAWHDSLLRPRDWYAFHGSRLTLLPHPPFSSPTLPFFWPCGFLVVAEPW